MKKVIFGLIVVLFTVTSKAQTGAKQQFVGSIFAPVPIGTAQPRVVYLKSAPEPRIFTTRMTAYAYVIGANNTIVEVPVVVEMVNPPSSWRRMFWQDDSGNPILYPLALPVMVDMKVTLAPNGKPVTDANGNLMGTERITF